jgi:beta-lactamase class A
LAAAFVIPLAGCAPMTGEAQPTATPKPTPLPTDNADSDFAALEAQYGARLGVFAFDPQTNWAVEYRADERFAFCSTFKALAAGAVLGRRSIPELEEVVMYSSDDLLSHSPITEGSVETGMTIRELCDAAVRYSDNTAANLLFADLGGPAGLTAILREQGDQVTQLDRTETDLNSAVPGDPRDTSTPRALAKSLSRYAIGDALPEDKRDILNGWLNTNTTGDTLIRAALPQGWQAGDKTGGGAYGTRNDIAIVYPPAGQPISVAILSSKTDRDADYDDTLIADAARIVLKAAS